jgi:hypothetical protein
MIDVNRGVAVWHGGADDGKALEPGRVEHVAAAAGAKDRPLLIAEFRGTEQGRVELDSALEIDHRDRKLEVEPFLVSGGVEIGGEGLVKQLKVTGLVALENLKDQPTVREIPADPRLSAHHDRIDRHRLCCVERDLGVANRQRHGDQAARPLILLPLPAQRGNRGLGAAVDARHPRDPGDIRGQPRPVGLGVQGAPGFEKLLDRRGDRLTVGIRPAAESDGGAIERHMAARASLRRGRTESENRRDQREGRGEPGLVKSHRQILS